MIGFTRIRCRRATAPMVGGLALFLALGGGLAWSSEGRNERPGHPEHPDTPVKGAKRQGPKDRCQTDADCDAGDVCRANGKCLKAKPENSGKKDVCTTDAQCDADEICKNGKCHKAKDDSCSSDAQCAADEVCKNYKCHKEKKDACTSDDQCEADEVCKNGKCHKEHRCKEDTDCDGNERCDQGTCVDSATPAVVEICGDCTDNDGNGLVDFEDPSCCPNGQSFVTALRRGRIVPKGATGKLKLAGILKAQGMSAGSQDIFVQIRERDGQGDLLCAQIPSARLTKKGRAFKYRAGKSPVPSAKGIDTLVVKSRRNDTIMYKAKGRRAQIAGVHAGPLQVTFGFLGKANDAENRCSAVITTFKQVGKAMVAVR